MGIKTGVIRYNLNDRGRKLIGQPRNFNIPRVMEIVNSDGFQEKIKAGDVVGYLGHGIRQEYGLEPPESIIKGGQVVPVDPAFRTISMRVYDDGTVEHEALFLDTPLGKTAQSWFESKIGGFSSVFSPNERNPTDFHGFDYVKSPNFNANRGYVMDSAELDKEILRLTSRQRAEFYSGKLMEAQAVMDAVVAGSMAKDELVEKLSKQNEELAACLDSLGCEAQELKKDLADATFELGKFQKEEKYEPLMKLSIGQGNWLNDAVAAFDSAMKNPERFTPKEVKGVVIDGYEVI